MKSVKDYFAGDVEWGAFLAGFLLGLIGVLFVYAFDGDTKSAWKGCAALVMLYLILYFAIIGAAVGASTAI